MTGWIAGIAALTMVVGNLLALPQTNLKRMLAYSGIAHIGYVLTALAAGTTFGAGMGLFYFVAYLFANAGAFLALSALESAGEEPTLAGVRNLARRSPVMAAAWLAFLLSLGGIPFVMGFWGKLYVLLAAGRAGLWWLVALGAALSVVALYYYLNVVRSMFILHEGDDRGPIAIPFGVQLAVVLCAVIVTAGGLAPHLFVEPALRAVRGF
jgi:NADH-quinone oxidoreductase subunit N